MSFPTVPIGAAFDVRNGATPSSSVHTYWDGEIPWVSPADLGKIETRYITTGARSISKEGYESCGTQMVPAGSIILSTRAPIGHIAIATQAMCFNQGCRGLVPRKIIGTNFAYWALVAHTPSLQAAGQGTTFIELARDKLRAERIPLPDLPTQKAIADFLDRETALIDLLIEKKQRLLELLQQKNEVESLALVVGQEHDERRLGKLDWASSLPLHWEERAVWMIFALGRGRVISHEDIAQSPGPYPIYSSQTANDGVLGHIDTFDFQGDYLTWTTDGAKAGTVFRRSGRFNCTNVCGTLRPLDSRLDLAYFRFALDRASGFFVRHDINPKLMNGVMAKIRVPFPPYEEQKAIGGRLTAQQERLTPVREKVAASIGRLREFRAALITAAVTGQIDPETWSRRGATDRCLDQIEAEMSA